MAEVVPIRPRTLAHILLDIEHAKWCCCVAQGTDLESASLDHLEALRDEARVMVKDGLNVTINQLMEAGL